jgi:type IV secretory pathway VirB6-like protein
MEMLMPMLSTLVTAIPSVIIDGTLLAMAVSRWNKHPRVSMYAATAAVMLLVTDLLVRAAFAILPLKLHESGRSASDLGVLYAIFGGISGLFHAVAMGLLVAAVFTDRGSVSPPRGLASVSER